MKKTGGWVVCVAKIIIFLSIFVVVVSRFFCKRETRSLILLREQTREDKKGMGTINFASDVRPIQGIIAILLLSCTPRICVIISQEIRKSAITMLFIF